MASRGLGAEPSCPPAAPRLPRPLVFLASALPAPASYLPLARAMETVSEGASHRVSGAAASTATPPEPG